jgi:cysteine-rich repeat protein
MCPAGETCGPLGGAFECTCVGSGSLDICGNGNKTGSEECDDGNSNNNDACTNTCKNAKCGDGFIWTGVEQCETVSDCFDLGYTGTVACTGCACSGTPPGGTGTGIGLSLDCPTVVGGTQADVIIKVWRISTGDAICVPKQGSGAPDSSLQIIGVPAIPLLGNSFRTCAVAGDDEYPVGSGRHLVKLDDSADPQLQNNTEHSHNVTVTYTDPGDPSQWAEKTCTIIFSPQPQKAPDVNMLLVVLVGIAGALAIRFKKK